MKHFPAVAAALILLGAPALAQTPSPVPAVPAATGPAGSPAPPPPAPATLATPGAPVESPAAPTTAPGTPAPLPPAPASPAPVTPAPPAPPASAPPVAPSPAATTNPYHFVYTPVQPAAPAADTGQILEIDLSDQTVHVPTHLMLRVVTSPNVAVLSLRTLGHEIVIPKVAPGLFAAQEDIPDLPFFLKGRSYNVDFIAATDAGKRTVITIPVGLR